MAELRNVRRYYLQRRRYWRVRDETSLAAVFQSKQEAEPGELLGLTFPHRSALSLLGYPTDADLDGADDDELVTAGLTRKQAREVIAAL